MNCPNCNKILRILEEERLNNRLARYKCARCKAWSKDNKKKVALWWVAMISLFLSFGGQYATLGFSHWLQSLFITISIVFLGLSYKQKKLVTDGDNL